MSTRKNTSLEWRGITVNWRNAATLKRVINEEIMTSIVDSEQGLIIKLAEEISSWHLTLEWMHDIPKGLERIIFQASILVVVLWESFKNSTPYPNSSIKALENIIKRIHKLIVRKFANLAKRIVAGYIIRDHGKLKKYEAMLDDVASGLEAKPSNMEINKVLQEVLDGSWAQRHKENLELSADPKSSGDKELKPIAVQSDEDGTWRQQQPFATNAAPSSESKMLIETAMSDDEESSDEDRVEEPEKSMKDKYTEMKTPNYLEKDNSIHPDWEEAPVDTSQEAVTSSLQQPLATTNMAALNADLARCQPQENIEMKSFWIVAERALNHVQENWSQIEAVFATHGFRKSDYVLYAGFDESLIQAEVGYLEQIHVFSLASITTSSESPKVDLLSQLGKIFSPFSSILFTESCVYELPVYKPDGTIWIFDELVLKTASKLVDRGSTADIPTVISMFDSSAPGENNPSGGKPPMQSGSNNQGKKEGNKGKQKENDKSRGRDDEEDNDNDPDNDSDPDDPDDDKGPEASATLPTFLFEVVSEILIIQNGVEQRFQILSVEGKIMTQETHLPPYSKCDVKFVKLNFDTERGTLNKGYEQTHLRVTIDPRDQNIEANVIQPKQSLASDGEIKDVSGWQRSLAQSGSIGFSLTGLKPQGTVTAGSSRTMQTSGTTEKKHYANRITRKTLYGVVRWGFHIDDEYDQEGGIKMQDSQDSRDSRLPHASFNFDSKSSKSAPRFVDVEVASYWSLMPSEKYGRKSLLDTMFSNARTDNINYSNMCQAVALTIPSILTKHSSYKATLKVNIADEELRPKTKNVRVSCDEPEVGTTASIDRANYKANEHGRWDNETLLGLPSIRQP